MKLTRKLAGPLALLAGLAAAACNHGPAARPAVLESSDADTMARLKSALGDAVGRSNIELGAGDPTQQPAVTVLPPPLGQFETNSPAAPTHFDLILDGATCYAVHRETGQRWPLEGIACRAVGE